MKMTSCAITGHRPSRFQFGYNEMDPGCIQLKAQLKGLFMHLYQQGVHRYYVGAALGVDQWAGETLLHIKAQPGYESLELVVAIPFAGHDHGWDIQNKERLAFLIAHSTEVVTVSSKSGQEGYRQRNYYMVDHADILVAVYDNDRSIRSGTKMTVSYAMNKKLPIIFIHPDTLTFSSFGREQLVCR